MTLFLTALPPPACAREGLCAHYERGFVGRLPGSLFNRSHFLAQSLQFHLPFLDAWVQFLLCSQVLPMLSEVVIHIALGSFGRVERDRQVGKLLMEVIHHGYVGLALADGREIRLDEFPIAGVGLVFLRLCEVLVPCFNATAELLD